jgi:hypothetical protein
LKTSVPAQQTTRHRLPEDNNLNVLHLLYIVSERIIIYKVQIKIKYFRRNSTFQRSVINKHDVTRAYQDNAPL